jgi:hypothetical protein
MRHVTVLLLALTVLGSAGCGAKAPVAPAAPVVVALPAVECPAPARPAIPALDPALPFDHALNVETFLERDDIFRSYAKALEDCVKCYGAQTGGDSGRN